MFSWIYTNFFCKEYLPTHLYLLKTAPNLWSRSQISLPYWSMANFLQLGILLYPEFQLPTSEIRNHTPRFLYNQEGVMWLCLASQEYSLDARIQKESNMRGYCAQRKKSSDKYRRSNWFFWVRSHHLSLKLRNYQLKCTIISHTSKIIFNAAHEVMLHHVLIT